MTELRRRNMNAREPSSTTSQAVLSTSARLGCNHTRYIRLLLKLLVRGFKKTMSKGTCTEMGRRSAGRERLTGGQKVPGPSRVTGATETR